MGPGGCRLEADPGLRHDRHRAANQHQPALRHALAVRRDRRLGRLFCRRNTPLRRSICDAQARSSRVWQRAHRHHRRGELRRHDGARFTAARALLPRRARHRAAVASLPRRRARRGRTALCWLTRRFGRGRIPRRARASRRATPHLPGARPPVRPPPDRRRDESVDPRPGRRSRLSARRRRHCSYPAAVPERNRRLHLCRRELRELALVARDASHRPRAAGSDASHYTVAATYGGSATVGGGPVSSGARYRIATATGAQGKNGQGMVRQVMQRTTRDTLGAF